jgi:hypothetical protein
MNEVLVPAFVRVWSLDVGYFLEKVPLRDIVRKMDLLE